MAEQVPIYFGLSGMLYHPNAGISTVLVNELAKAGHPGLEGSRIRIGANRLTSRVAPPSIVATWTGGRGQGSEYGKEFPSAQFRATEPVLNSLATHVMQVDFHCWGVSAQPDSDEDEDAAMFLVHQLWRVIHKVGVEGAYEILGIEATPPPKSALGAHAVLSVAFHVPVTDEIQLYIPAGTKPVLAIGFSNATPVDQVLVRGQGIS